MIKEKGRKMTEKLKLWIFDIDGTLANNSARITHLKGTVKDWKSFFADQSKDEPYEAVTFILNLLLANGERCITITGRAEEHRNESFAWINNHSPAFPEEDLLMRPNGEKEDDDTLKLKMLAKWMEENPGYEVAGIFEDRHRVIDAYRNAGYYVFEANQLREPF
jgi:FMN phosphatase YigB (HAD superfamily)